MKNFILKIVNSFLAISFAFGLITFIYYTTKHETASLSASILDTAAPAQVCQVEFVTPKGSAYPVNGVVTIQAVNVQVDTGSGWLPYCDGAGDVLTNEVVSGSELEGSFITFSTVGTSDPCPLAGTVLSGNTIIMPSSFSSSCTIQIDVPGTSPISTQELTIEPASCTAFQTSIIRGYGEGLATIASANLGTFAVTAPANGFDFKDGTVFITSSIDINYPVADNDVPNAKTFQIHIELKPDIGVDPINGIDARAKIVSNTGDGVYEIHIRTEGAGNEVQTALNFAYVFNDLLGTDSPFIAYPDPADPDSILLQATEMGDHPHDGTGEDYVCIVDGNQVGPQCFSLGTNGNGVGLGVLTTPLKLDNEVLQGDSGIVFASNSSGEIEWITSHPSILEVTTLSEASQEGQSTVDFVDELLDDAVAVENIDETLATGATFNITNCLKAYDSNTDAFETETCTVEASFPVDYNISGISYTANVSVDSEVVAVTVQGNTLNGFVTGSGVYTTGGGFSINLSGTVTGVVTGSTSGTHSGTVTGQIVAPITASVSGLGAGSGVELTPSGFEGLLNPVVPVEGILTDSPGSFTSTVKKQEDDISHVAIIYAKRPGISILTALDKQGCIASFEIEVIEKQVVLQMVGRDPGDVLDVSDTVQINAFVGGANSELEEYKNITAASGIEWFSSNEEVASIDQTGLLTALKPGVTNLTARYDTGDTEIGTIESLPMKVTVNKIAGLRVTFDKGTEDKLSAEVVNAAHKSVIIAIHNPEAAGQTFVIEGQTVTITLPAGTYSNDISKIDAIVNDPTDGLAKKISDLQDITATNDLISVTTIEGYPGMLILQPDEQSIDHDGDSIEDIDENGIIDIDTTALEVDVSILPTYNNAIPLPASETYGLMVIAQYDNGATKLLPPTQFSWVNTPVNYLEQALLDSGLIKMGEISGTSTVVAEYENADGSVVRSNYLTITVDSGPVIEFVRRIGSGSVTKGSRILMQTKISDVDTIADISSISTSIVYSTFNTYQQINEDSGAIWFSATPFLSEVTVVEQSSSGGEGEGEGEGETETPAPIVLQYKTYNIPIEIPVDQNLFDGVYSLILSITDNSNHTLNYVYPIRIGEIGEGDVNGDGKTNMVDVILAFQIAAGINPSPTPSELQAANVDGIGGVTLIDVILLFNKVTNKP